MSVKLMGDPHLGRSFIHGVPLHRRGERERMMWDKFEAELMTYTNYHYHINMGDLFDKSVVPYDVILRAAQVYKYAANLNPQTQYIILRGNHDVSRDLEKASAFDVFTQLVSSSPNILVINEPTQIEDMLFMPFDPVISAEEMLYFHRLCQFRQGVKEWGSIVFGHWDTEFQGPNLIPTKALAGLGIKTAYTGHVHKPDKFVRDDVEVNVVGSLQPYAHGEEVDEDLYVTRTLDQVRDDPTLYKDKCLRILGGVPDFDIDCLQLTIKREQEDDLGENVTLGDFNMENLFAQAFDLGGVPAELRSVVLDRYASVL